MIKNVHVNLVFACHLQLLSLADCNDYTENCITLLSCLLVHLDRPWAKTIRFIVKL